ncbi:hypothetical protein TRVA0_011S00540 [Trichomonascus vanleenenianus]|uniref:SANT/Myb-like DNA-binding domain-containing protein n=1 Tax=Trichomonascus vanleenenianus TaxID=2268995 RepID=UPI003EC9B509
MNNYTTPNVSTATYEIQQSLFGTPDDMFTPASGTQPSIASHQSYHHPDTTLSMLHRPSHPEFHHYQPQLHSHTSLELPPPLTSTHHPPQHPQGPEMLSSMPATTAPSPMEPNYLPYAPIVAQASPTSTHYASATTASNRHPSRSPSVTAARPKIAPKPKFSPEDDNLLIELKENRKMTWRQIAEHFDGRTAGALQVRYCTKLKSRNNSWSEKDLSALKRAIQEYEEDRWNAIAQKLGNRFSPSACREKFTQLDDIASPLSSSSSSPN